MTFKADSSFLARHLKHTAIHRDPFRNPENLKAVQSYIRSEFESFGYEVSGQEFRYEGRVFQNLIARRKGAADIPNFLVAAHFDAVPETPGADDNASGVAAMLEAARLTASMHPSVNVQFAAFNLEEYDMVGSRYYTGLLKDVLKTRAKEFLGMISLEMVGYISREKGSQKMPNALKPFYPDTGDFLALVGDENSSALLAEAQACFSKTGVPAHSLPVPMKGAFFPEVRLSDHSPFWDAGFPALLVTDTSFFRNPNYHLPSDTAATLDLDFLARVSEGTAELICSLKSV